MVKVNIDVPNDKVQRVIDAMNRIYPIPKDIDDNPLFNETDWAKECVRRFIVRTVQRYETLKSQKENTVSQDDTIATLDILNETIK